MAKDRAGHNSNETDRSLSIAAVAFDSMHGCSDTVSADGQERKDGAHHWSVGCEFANRCVAGSSVELLLIICLLSRSPLSLCV